MTCNYCTNEQVGEFCGMKVCQTCAYEVLWVRLMEGNGSKKGKVSVEL